MALSTRKKNIIIADWKAGRFNSAYSLAKAHKVSDKTVTKLINGITQENLGAVEAGIKYEMAKKSVKNPIEQRAVEKAVDDITKHKKLIENLTLKNVSVLAKKLDGEATIQEHKLAGETIHKAGQTLGVIDQFSPKANSEVAVQVNTQVNTDRKGLADYYEEV